MIEDCLVIDATVHAFNFGEPNLKVPFMHQVVDMLYHFVFDTLHPLGDNRYHLTFEEFQGLFTRQPHLMEQVLFAESQTDVAIYHGVPMYGFFGDGSSPIWVAQQIREKLPHRMFVYGDISAWQPDALARVDDLVDNHQVIGLKFYPVDMIDGQIRRMPMNDEKRVFPLLEHARNRGVKVVAVHKAVPLGPIPRDLYRVDDLAPLISTFPDITFEIVHGGFAFAEETASLLARFDNVSINLETNPCFALNMAERFADMLAPLLATGRHDRLFYGTGSVGCHPQPFLEAFWRFEMPRGYPLLSQDMKRGILGANFARQHGWNLSELQQSCATDRYGLHKTLDRPWSSVRAVAAAA